MQIDNSRSKAYLFCPEYYREKYVNNIEKDWSKAGKAGSTSFGSRVHELLEEHFKRMKGLDWSAPPPDPLSVVEDEAQGMIAAYKAHYPQEEFEVVDVERTFEIPLPNGHSYIGKLDGVVREPQFNMLCILEHKTERRLSKDNHPEAWAAREQASRYLWACEQLYGEPFRYLILDVLTRQSPAGREPCMFRRDYIERTTEQKERSIRNLVWVADQIEEMEKAFGKESEWPRNSDHCKDDWKVCDFYQLHVVGRDEFTLSNYRPTKPYLEL